MRIHTGSLGRAAAVLVIPTVLLLAAGPTHADPAAVSTQIVNQTITVPFTNSCTEQTGTVTIHFTEVLHATDRPVDTSSLVMNLSGDFVLVLDSGLTITGHFADLFVIGGGENQTLSSVLTAHGTASDGSHFSLHFRVIQTENGLGALVVDLQMC